MILKKLQDLSLQGKIKDLKYDMIEGDPVQVTPGEFEIKMICKWSFSQASMDECKRSLSDQKIKAQSEIQSIDASVTKIDEIVS